MRLIPRRVFGCSLLLLFACLTSSVQAASPVTGSGLNTQVSPPVTLPSGQTQFNITGGTRPGGASGTNLFHSFGDFNVPNLNIANFFNDSGLATSNILGRVTGGNISNIFGAIQTQGFGNANLFLMNPAGFLFGPNATVNAGGMVSFSSADYLRLADGIRFLAIPNTTADGLLSAAPVAAFGFLGSNPGAITVQGSQLSVTPGQSISLVGGSITVQSGIPDEGSLVQPGRLSAPGGQINIASVASPGEILLSNLQSAPNINGQSFTAMGNISLSEGALLDVSGDAAGTVRIRGGQLVMDTATISADTVNSHGAPVAIDINVTGDISLSTVDSPVLTARTTGSGSAGEVRISSKNLEVTATALNNFIVPIIDTHTEGSGKAGDVVITAANNLTATLTGDGFAVAFLVDSGTLGPGQGGNVTLTAKNIDMASTSINTGVFVDLIFGENVAGSGGNLTITADLLRMGAGPLGINSLLVTDASPVLFGGRGGNLTITAHDIQLKDGSGLSTSGNTAGAMRINADQLIADSSQFEVDNLSGPSGGITITGKVVEFTNGSTVASQTVGNQRGGNITVAATDHLTLSDDPTAFGTLVRPSGLFTNSLSGFDPNSLILGTLGTAGAITVTTPNLQILGGARIDSSSRTSGNAGPITITANNISISGEGPIRGFPEPQFDQGGLSSGIYSRTNGGQFCSGPCGDAAPISITTGSFSLTQGAQVDSSTSSSGRGGDITINANQISITGTRTDSTPGGIFSRTTGTAAGSGNGGIIELHAGQFQVTNVAQISASTLGSGKAGSVTIEGTASPAQSVLIDGTGSGVFTDTHGTAAGGAIIVNSSSVTLQNDGALSAATSGTAPSATGGTITVNAEHVALNSNGVITTDTNGIASAGTIDINTSSLAINSGGQIRSSSGAEQPLVAALAEAPTLTGGTITVQGQGGAGSQAGSVTIDGTGSGIFTQSSGSRSGGDINIVAGGAVNLTNDATISASSTGGGKAGSVMITAGNQFAMTNSTVTTEATQSGGGAIKITTNPNGTVQLTNSTISASVLDGTGGGGSVNIDPQYVVLQNSQILAQAVQGPGGNINITTNLLLPDSTSLISASSQFGQQGTVMIQSPISPASGKIVPLGQKPLLPTSLLSQRCAALAGGNASSFTVAGRDSLPAEPGGWLSSPLALATAELVSSTTTEPETRTTRSTEEMPIVSLRRIAPSGFLNQSFATDSSTGCTS